MGHVFVVPLSAKVATVDQNAITVRGLLTVTWLLSAGHDPLIGTEAVWI